MSIRLSLASVTSELIWSINFAVSTFPFAHVVGVIGGMSLGDRPMWSWNGKKPVDLLMVFMIANLTHGSVRTQPFWFLMMWYWRHWFTVLFVCLLALSVSRWIVVDMPSLIPTIIMSLFQKCEKNNLSLSEIISWGNPFSQYQLSKNTCAKSSAEMSVHVGIILTSDPNLSVIVAMQLNPSPLGNGLMKSTAMLSPHSSGTGRG